MNWPVHAGADKQLRDLKQEINWSAVGERGQLSVHTALFRGPSLVPLLPWLE